MLNPTVYVVHSTDAAGCFEVLSKYLDTVLLLTNYDVFVEGSSMKTVSVDNAIEITFDASKERFGKEHHLHPVSAGGFEESVATIFNIPTSENITFRKLARSEFISEKDTVVYRGKRAAVVENSDGWFLSYENCLYKSLNAWILAATGKVRLSGNDIESLIVSNSSKEVTWVSLRRQYKADGMSLSEQKGRTLNALGFEGKTYRDLIQAVNAADAENSLAEVVCKELSHCRTLDTFFKEVELNATVRKIVDGLAKRFPSFSNSYGSPIEFFLAIQSEFACAEYTMKRIEMKERRSSVKIGGVEVPAIFDNFELAKNEEGARAIVDTYASSIPLKEDETLWFHGLSLTDMELILSRGLLLKPYTSQDFGFHNSFYLGNDPAAAIAWGLKRLMDFPNDRNLFTILVFRLKKSEWPAPEMKHLDLQYDREGWEKMIRKSRGTRLVEQNYTVPDPVNETMHYVIGPYAAVERNAVNISADRWGARVGDGRGWITWWKQPMTQIAVKSISQLAVAERCLVKLIHFEVDQAASISKLKQLFDKLY